MQKRLLFEKVLL